MSSNERNPFASRVDRPAAIGNRPNPLDFDVAGMSASRRREFLRAFGIGALGVGALGMGLPSLRGNALARDLVNRKDPLAPAPPHVTPPAKRVIYLFMFGGPSQMDLFDYKPVLQKYHGKTIQYERRRNKKSEGFVLGSQRKFERHGQTGQWCSDAFRHIPRHIDKMAIIKSLQTDSFAHGSAVLQMNSGQILQGHPALGAWLSYGLGTQNQNLPAFVVMHDPRGGPISGPANWTNGYMPASFQGTLFRSAGDPVLNLSARTGARATTTRSMQEAHLEALAALNRDHMATRSGYSELPARDASFQLAHMMQDTAPEALDLSQEDEQTKEMYGLYDPAPDHKFAVGPAVFGRQCLTARRLIERGVRVVQIYHGGGAQQQSWDAHGGVEQNLRIHCPEVDRPIDGLLTDLERRGLLDDTLVVWGGEFGRQPVSQQSGAGQISNPDGRDHNPKAFTMWLAGAGVRPGSYGETDELGFQASVNPHHIRDLHATVMHLMGLDHERLTYRHAGLERKLTGVLDAKIIHGVIA